MSDFRSATAKEINAAVRDSLKNMDARKLDRVIVNASRKTQNQEQAIADRTRVKPKQLRQPVNI